MTRSRLQSLRPGSDPTIGSYSPGGFQKGAKFTLHSLIIYGCDQVRYTLFCDVKDVDYKLRDSVSQRLNDPIMEPKVTDFKLANFSCM